MAILMNCPVDLLDNSDTSGDTRVESRQYAVMTVIVLNPILYPYFMVSQQISFLVYGREREKRTSDK